MLSPVFFSEPIDERGFAFVLRELEAVREGGQIRLVFDPALKHIQYSLDSSLVIRKQPKKASQKA
jgi:hypothetical protein